MTINSALTVISLQRCPKFCFAEVNFKEFQLPTGLDKCPGKYLDFG